MHTNSIIKVSGNVVEVCLFEDAVLFGYKVKQKPRMRLVDVEQIAAVREQTLRGAKSFIQRLVNTNNHYWLMKLQNKYFLQFITVTFRDNITDLDYANRELSKYVMRLNNHIHGKVKQQLKYLGVIQFQKRGAVHYHILFFNLPFVENIYDVFRKLWKHGTVNIESVRNVKNIGNYICRYMVKDFKDPRLRGRKCYIRSDGLEKPTVIKNDIINLQIINEIPPDIKTYRETFVNEFQKKVEYAKHEFPHEHPILQKIYRIRG